MTNILVDTCFWYALYDESDQYHATAQKIQDYLEYGNILIPHPVLYETLNTKFTKKHIRRFDDYLKRDSTFLISDEKYKSIALNLVLESSIEGKRPMSLVDMTIRLMMEDVNLHIGALITFNVGDFVDICCPNRIELISH